MSSSFWATFIGYLYATVCALWALYLFTGLVGLHDIGRTSKSLESKHIDPDTIDKSTDVELVKFSRKLLNEKKT